jgi:hypothetical protein
MQGCKTYSLFSHLEAVPPAAKRASKPTWKYFGGGKASPKGPWTKDTFDDSTWSQGQPPLGFGAAVGFNYTTAIADNSAAATKGRLSYYFRYKLCLSADVLAKVRRSIVGRQQPRQRPSSVAICSHGLALRLLWRQHPDLLGSTNVTGRAPRHRRPLSSAHPVSLLCPKPPLGPKRTALLLPKSADRHAPTECAVERRGQGVHQQGHSVQRHLRGPRRKVSGAPAHPCSLYLTQSLCLSVPARRSAAQQHTAQRAVPAPLRTASRRPPRLLLALIWVSVEGGLSCQFAKPAWKG